MLSGKRRLQLGQLEQRFHQQRRDRRCGSSAPGRRGCPRRSRRARRRAAAACAAISSSAIFSISLRLLHLVGDFGDDDLPGAAALVLLRASGRAGGSRRGRSRRPRRIEARSSTMMPPVGKSGPWTKLVIRSAIGRRRGLLDQMQRRVAEFGGVVRRDRGRHADGDAATSRWRAGSGSAPGRTTGSSSSSS